MVNRLQPEECQTLENYFWRQLLRAEVAEVATTCLIEEEEVAQCLTEAAAIAEVAEGVVICLTEVEGEVERLEAKSFLLIGSAPGVTKSILPGGLRAFSVGWRSHFLTPGPVQGANR